jgi:hypothetical protein
VTFPGSRILGSIVAVGIVIYSFARVFDSRIPYGLYLASYVPILVWMLLFTAWALRTGTGVESWGRIPQPRWLALLTRVTGIATPCFAMALVVRYYLL